MFLVLSVRSRHVIASRRDQLLHERVECCHLGSGISQLVRNHGSYGSSLEIAPHRFKQQVAVLRDFLSHQFPCTLNLIEILHCSLCIGEVFQHLVLYTVYAVERHRHRCFCGDNLLLRLLAFLVDVL